MLSPNALVSLKVEKPAAGGRMIARADGQVVFVAGAIPGERVMARIDRVTKNIAYATTAVVEETSADRRPVSGDPLCGGCLYAHIAYPRQLALKAEIIADALTRIGRITPPAPVAVAGSREDGYRMRARLHARGSRVGFFREGSHDVCEPRQTRQLLPATCDTLDRMSAVIRSLGADAVRDIDLSENGAATARVVHLETASPLDPRTIERIVGVEGLTRGPYVADTLTIAGSAVTLRRHVLSFFQGNRYLLQDFVAHVMERVEIGTSLLDLYAGVGLFAVSAAVTRGAWVVAVEGERIAADDLHANAAASHAQMTTVRAPVEHAVTGHQAAMGAAPGGGRRGFETVIVDPPRTGMSREALDGTIALSASRIIYVSCDVATLARDARRLVDAGYAIERLDGFDLFPNTPHVETVAVFVRA